MEKQNQTRARIGRFAPILSIAILSCVFIARSVRRVSAQEMGGQPTTQDEGTLVSIESMIESTRANTIRNPTTASLDWQPFNSTERSASWAAGKSIVLVEGSTTVPLTALDGDGNVQNNAEWEVIRNPNDSALLSAAPFPPNDLSVTPIPATPGVAALSLNAVGSFSVVAYLDPNGLGHYDPSDVNAVFWNVVVCRVNCISDNTKANNVAETYGFEAGSYLLDGALTNGDMFSVNFGLNSDPTVAGILFDAYINVVGGGGTGRLGLSRLYSDWSNNGVNSSAVGHYGGGHSVVQFVPNVDLNINFGCTYSSDPLPTAQFPALTPALDSSHPILDVPPEQHPNNGGNTICYHNIPLTLPASQPDLGAVEEVRAWDAPAGAFAVLHPKFGTTLKEAEINLGFVARLVVWTEGPTGISAGKTLYSCADEVPWSCEAKYSHFHLATQPATSPSTQTAVADVASVSTQPDSPFAPAVSLESRGAEVMPPVFNYRASLFDAHQ